MRFSGFVNNRHQSSTNPGGMNRTFEWRAAIAVMWVRSNHQSGTTQAGKYQPFEWDSAMPARWQLIVPARLNGI
jgi:hypothetical protein